MPAKRKAQPTHRETTDRLARRALFGFILTFLIARADVFLIMAHLIPNGYLFMGQTHVHHLNYGIFLLSVVAAYSIFCRPAGFKAEATALFYGLSMALTFDEFGMWLHLGGSYWQRASVDAVIVIAAVMALVAFGRSIKKFESSHIWAFTALTLALGIFIFVLFKAGDSLGNVVGPKLEELEESSSP
ncbi:MAG TPA: hypothetical protein VK791_11145 [bacterium]|nr:hypothetical protein [bacterium]